MTAIQNANVDHALAYGRDPWTTRATALLREHFGEDLNLEFTFGGTGANIVGLSAVVQSYESVVCAESAHLWQDESTAPERWLGAKFSPIPTPDGKLRPADVAPVLTGWGQIHRAQPRVVSVSQATEWGTVYSVDELTELGDFCHAHDLNLHVDGARLANAAATLETTLRGCSSDCGADALYCGAIRIVAEQRFVVEKCAALECDDCVSMGRN